MPVQKAGFLKFLSTFILFKKNGREGGDGIEKLKRENTY